MTDIINALSKLGIPAIIISVIVLLFILIQIIGELCELKGKIVPEFMKIRKYFKRRKEEKKNREQLLSDVKELLGNVNEHYSADNITMRNDWMTQVNETMNWVHQRANVYDASIQELRDEFEKNRQIAELLFVQNCRTTILDFATKVGRPDYITTKDEFRRVFKVYEQYEAFLQEHGMENGEVDDAMAVIHSEHQECLRQNKFLEARRLK